MRSNFSQDTTFFQKLKEYDYLLLLSILSLGIISIFAMYSTDGGEILYHTKSHFLKFAIFFPMMIANRTQKMFISMNISGRERGCGLGIIQMA